MPQIHDAIVLGGTPAGYAAAYCLARRKARVAVLEAPGGNDECVLTDWAPAGSLTLPGLPRGLTRACKASTFTRVCYHNVGLDRTVKSAWRKVAGVFVDYGALLSALRAAATGAGAKVRSTTTPPAIQLAEDRVLLLGSVEVAGRLLLVAGNASAQSLSNLIPSAQPAPAGQMTAVGLDVPLTARQARPLDGNLHVVEMPRRGEMGIYLVHRDALHLRVVARAPALARAGQLSDMLRRLQGAGLLPSDLRLSKARGAVWNPPGGVALDLETHVAKRCLIAGTAGGFADSVTGQTIRPSLESAILAAETALAAMRADNFQTQLGRYRSAWRSQMTRYLTPPSTSLHLLLPLVFVNQDLVERYTRAMLDGLDI